MDCHVVGIMSYPWGADLKFPPPATRNVFYLYRYAVWYKANPRNNEYMRSLFSERYPEGKLINADEDEDWLDQLKQAGRVVLLYPDPIGLGFWGMDRAVFRYRKTWAGVRVLNGRRREFRLNRTTWMGLCIRRGFERIMLLEAIASLGFIVLTPVLAAYDRMRGRT